MKRLLAAAVLMTLVLTAAASGGRPSATRTVSSSRLADDGNIRITASIRTPAQVGRSLNVIFRVHNVSDVTRKLNLDYATSFWLVIHSPDGTTYDTRTAYRLTGSLGGPYRPPTKVRPGKTVTRRLFAPRVRWSGPLRITPGWNVTALPTLHVAVPTPGPTPSVTAAMADVLASTGRLLDGCTPTNPSVAVRGTLAAPDNSAPTMRVACSIHLHREGGFVRAQVLVVSPPGLRGVHLEHPYEELPWLTSGKNATAVGWLFVVTSGGAVSVGSTDVDTSKNRARMAPQWQWTTSGFQPQPGGSRCGGSGGGGGDYGGPLITFVSKCR